MSVLLLQMCLLMAGSHAAAATNLIANPSVETPDATGSAPLNWQHGSWGTNTAAFSYPTGGGHQGSRSVRVDVSNYVNGDAKWYFDPVTVAPNSDYVFIDYYKADVATTVVAECLDSANNVVANLEMSPAPVASPSTWTKAGFAVHTTATTSKLTIMHLIAKNGFLQTDDFSLAAQTPIPITDFVPNNSVEQVSDIDTNMPAGWQQGSWGTNVHTFGYANEGHTGSRSVRVDVTSYNDNPVGTAGDAKWFFNPQPLTRGQAYRFSAYYKTNVVPRVVAMFEQDDGTEAFFGMPNPQPGADAQTQWQLYSDTFVVPATAKATTVFFFLDKVGWVESDDYHLATYQPVGFSRPLVTLTFDDSFEDNVTSVIPRLATLGFKATQFVCTQYVEGNVPGVVPDPNAVADILAFKNAGFEIGSHSVTHPFLTQMTAAQVDYELSHSQSYLQGLIGAPVKNFASPYGDYNVTVNNAIRTYYKSHRTVDEGSNSKDNLDPYRIRVQNMQTTTTLAQYQSWLDRAKADKTWLVLVYHRVTDDTPEQYDTRTADFDQQMAALKASGMTVKTYNDALDEVCNPVPAITTISPSSTTAGDAAFTLTVNGTGFNSSSVVNWNGAGRTSNYVSSTQLTAAITAADVAAAGTASVTVFNPAPGGGTSAAATFTVAFKPPHVTGISPVKGNRGQTLTGVQISGTDFRGPAGNVTAQLVNGTDTITGTITGVTATRVTATFVIPNEAKLGAWDVYVKHNDDSKSSTLAGAFTINNPMPAIAGLSPDTGTAGGAAFTLTVNGTGFNSSSVVKWGGSGRATTLVSAIQLTASISADDIATAGTGSITVFNPTPGGGTSNVINFKINNPVPTINRLSPDSKTAGQGDFTLLVIGTGFNANSVVKLNASGRATTFVSTILLTASIRAADIATAGTRSITVFNPTPGGARPRSHVDRWVPAAACSRHLARQGQPGPGPHRRQNNRHRLQGPGGQRDRPAQERCGHYHRNGHLGRIDPGDRRLCHPGRRRGRGLGRLCEAQ